MVNRGEKEFGDIRMDMLCYQVRRVRIKQVGNIEICILTDGTIDFNIYLWHEKRP
jgi:hypothetical protein